jgi:hypothetical protein
MPRDYTTAPPHMPSGKSLAPAAMPGIVIEDFRPLARNALRGFARVRMPSGMVIHDVCVFEQDSKRWVMPPSKPAITSEGSVFRKDGKPVYTPVISFADKTSREKFCNAIVAAVEASHPEVFA